MRVIADSTKERSDHCVGGGVDGFDWGNVNTTELDWVHVNSFRVFLTDLVCQYPTTKPPKKQYDECHKKDMTLYTLQK